ncbi:DsbA family oxidoreductase [Rhizobium sp. FKL33]|uniref:DsbA family oxidoreductase n=1 Tax=Rhizobium sp. FKL33 TaxID=2562307 RepID=UPI0010BFA575|nr:DsbA family oxidoreductase [Rhizobium sp. FKL33]
MNTATVKIDIISDVVCPWCYLGQARLGLALDRVKDALTASITWKPYQLEPNAPAEGLDTFDYLARKIGGADAVKRSHQMLTQLGDEIGLPFALDKAKIFPNTLDAHRLIHWAAESGAETQNAVSKALFSANFVEGLNVGDHAVLLGIAEQNGMNRAVLAEKLASDVDVDTVKNEIAAAQRMGVSGVPCFVIDDQYVVTGAQSMDVFENAFRQLAAMKA